MRIGIVTKWFNRGQPVVGRYLRSALEELGHETLVLARPKKKRGPRPGALDRDDVWDQPGITEASAYEIPMPEYEAWVEANAIEAIFCDQNYQFDEIAALRDRGVRTVGRFVWEAFAEEHVEGARRAFEVVYSFTRAEQARYAALGLESPYVTWGIHPELVEAATERGRTASSASRGEVRLIFPGGFIGHRKPIEPVVEAFRRTEEPGLRLLVKSQVDRKRLDPARELAESDPRIEFMLTDQPRGEHLRTFASCDACVAISRWEGLGLPLYEALAFGMPTITNDHPPMNEAIADGVSGLLVRSLPDGEARSGIEAVTPDVDELAAAMSRMADPELRARLEAGATRVRETERAWSHTVEGMAELIERLERVPVAR